MTSAHGPTTAPDAAGPLANRRNTPSKPAGNAQSSRSSKPASGAAESAVVTDTTERPAAHRPVALSPQAFVALQRSAGNRASCQILAPPAAVRTSTGVRTPTTVRTSAAHSNFGQQPVADSAGPAAIEPESADHNGIASTVQRAPVSAIASPDEPTSGDRGPTFAGNSAPLPAQREEEDSGLLAGIRRRISSVTDGVRSGWSSLTGAASAAFEAVKSRGQSILQQLTDQGAAVVTTLRSGWTSVTGIVSTLQNAAKQGVANALGGIFAAAGRLRQAVMSMDADAVESAWAGVTGAASAAWQGATAAGRALADGLGNAWNRLKTGFSTGLDVAGRAATAVATAVKDLAVGAAERVKGLWNGLTERAGQLGGVLGAVGRLLRPVVERLLSGARSVWQGVQSQWDRVKSTAAGIKVQVVSAATAAWERAKSAASGVFDGISGAWTRVKAGASSAFDRISGGIRSAWQRLQRFSIGSLVSKLRRYTAPLRAIEEVIADPEATLAPFATPIATTLASGMPGAAEDAARSRVPGGAGELARPPAASLPPVQRQEAPETAADARTTSSFAELWAGLKAAFKDKWAKLDVKKMALDALISIVWPWPKIGEEFSNMGKDFSKAAGNLFMPRNLLADPLGCLHDLWSDVMKLLDFPLILWRRLNNIALLLLGPITIALTVIGFIGGSIAGTVLGTIAGALAGVGIGAAPGAGVGLAGGGVGGAGAGFGVAMSLGQAFLISFVAGEATALVKVLADLLTTRQTRMEKADDYNTAADSSLGLGITAVLVGLGWIGGRVASACMAVLRRSLPASVLAVIDEFAAGVRRARTGEPENKTDNKEPPPEEQTPVDPTVPDMRVPGPQTLTAAELAELQGIANKYRTTLRVVGSRGRGMGRAVETELQPGKGPGTRSDIDVVIDGQVDIDTRGGLSGDVSGACNGAANVASSTGVASGPHITIAPAEVPRPPSGSGAPSERPTIPPGAPDERPTLTPDERPTVPPPGPRGGSSG